MSKKLLIVLLTLLLLGTGVVLYLHNRSSKAIKPDQAAVTGITVTFTEPVSKAQLTITDNRGKQVKQILLTSGGTRYNVGLNPGVYKAVVASPDNLFAPVESSAVTVTDHKLTELNIAMSGPRE